jgi:hypothetical protein
MHAANQTVATPLNTFPHEQLCPGSTTLADVQKRFR